MAPTATLPSRTPFPSAATDGGDGESGASGGHLLEDAVRGSLLKALRSLLEATGEPLQDPVPRGLPSSLTGVGGRISPVASLAAATAATTELREMTEETLMNGQAVDGTQDQLPFALIKAIVLVIVVTILLLSTCKLLFKVMTSSPIMRDMKD